MAFDLAKLFASSFRGVPFLTDGVTDTGGQKTVTHEFVNSDDRFVEGLGVLNDRYQVTAVIAGDDYLVVRNQLRAAMKKAGTGEFVHPFEGPLNVYPISYSIDQTDTRLGQATFSLVFDLVPATDNTTAQGVPIQSSLSPAQASALADTANAELEGSFVENFSVSSNFTSNYLAAKEVLGQVSDTFDSVISTTAGVADQISAAQGAIDDFTDDITTLILTPQILATRLTGLYESVTNIAPNALASFDSVLNFFDFGDPDTGSSDTQLTPINPDNPITVERQSNQLAVSTQVQAGALIEAYRAVTLIGFTTVDDVTEVENALNTQFDAVVGEVRTGDPSLDASVVLNNTSREAIADLRSNIKLFLTEQKIQAFKLSTIKTQPISASALAYQYYGSTDNTSIIIEQNGIGDVSLISGEVEIPIDA